MSEGRDQRTASVPGGAYASEGGQGGYKYLIKVDVQGAELDVLRGAIETLNETELVILEVSMFEFMVNLPQFYDVVSI